MPSDARSESENVKVDSAHDVNDRPFLKHEVVATILGIMIALAVDDVNPVKVLASYSSSVGVSESHYAWLAAVWLLGLGIIHRKEFVYKLLRLFFRCSCNNMFFRQVEVVGMENMPREGPMILTGNHNNQFVDGLMLLTNCHREISFMIAQKSWDRPVVGFVARCFHCIPVARPQDLAFKGAGRVRSSGTCTLHGVDTQFMKQVTVGSHVEIENNGKLLKVVKVDSDTDLTLAEEVAASAVNGGETYKVVPRVDQGGMYEAVFAALKQGSCLGIFPEGGSHDQTDILPLKAGVAKIAIDAWNKHALKVPIVPVGLNYFRGHHFGGRVVIEFGTPINVPDTVHAQALLQSEEERRAATDELLQVVTRGMKSVIVPSQDYYTLQQIYMVRRLYMDDGMKLTADKVLDLTRRFAVGIQVLMRVTMEGTAEGGKLDDDSKELTRWASDSDSCYDQDLVVSSEEAEAIMELKAELESYMAALKSLGLRDHQVRQLAWWDFADLVGGTLYLVGSFLVAAVPQICLNLPVGYIAAYLAKKDQVKALKSSTVKVKALDVVMSYRIIYVVTMVPIVYILYGFYFMLFSHYSSTTCVIIMGMLPAFSFCGMKASEQGLRTYNDVLPLFKRLLPEARKQQDELPVRRKQLQKKLKNMVRLFGPRMGDLYRAKDVDWEREIKRLSNPTRKLSRAMSSSSPQLAPLSPGDVPPSPTKT